MTKCRTIILESDGLGTLTCDFSNLHFKLFEMVTRIKIVLCIEHIFKFNFLT